MPHLQGTAHGQAARKGRHPNGQRLVPAVVVRCMLTPPKSLSACLVPPQPAKPTQSSTHPPTPQAHPLSAPCHHYAPPAPPPTTRLPLHPPPRTSRCAPSTLSATVKVRPRSLTSPSYLLWTHSAAQRAAQHSTVDKHHHASRQPCRRGSLVCPCCAVDHAKRARSAQSRAGQGHMGMAPAPT